MRHEAHPIVFALARPPGEASWVPNRLPENLQKIVVVGIVVGIVVPHG